MKRNNGEKYKTSRAVYKAVKKYDHQQFDEFCARVYAEGYNAGLKQPAEETEPSVSMEEVLKVIGEVKGVGPALAGKIRNAVDNMIVERRGKSEKQIN